MNFIPLLTIVVGCAVFLFFLYFALVSRREEERRATRMALTMAVLLPIPFLSGGLVEFESQTAVCIGLLGISILGPLVLLLPIGNSFAEENDTPTNRIDERDIMFARKDLVPGSDRFNEYYERHPERKALDDVFRSRPGLMRPRATQYDRVTAAAADASFNTVAAFHPMLEADTLPEERHISDPARMTRFLKEWIKQMGAESVGIAKLQDYHLYETIGRGDRYGESVELSHKYAVAFTVEMVKSAIDMAPKGPTLMESARQYLNSGAVAVQVQEFIRQIGYPARAHIDGSYRVVCPLVAREAGLGEIGRMGLLMTPELGPRVRIAVVTTDLPLIPDERKRDGTVIDFCTRCKKCADVCPSKSISFDERTEIDGVSRWQINSDSCYAYWCAIGTDCARCMSVCPYSHPDNALHNLVRFGLKRSGPFREFALKMDDLFYGRNPVPIELPDWIMDIVDEDRNQS